MAGFVLTSEQSADVTVISNKFIDHYMCSANGEYVKIYLYLLRSSQTPSKDCSMSFLADKMNLMESDVLRALHYWQQQGLLKLKTAEDHTVEAIVLTGSYEKSSDPAATTPVKAEVQAPALEQSPRHAEPEVLQELALLAEQYLKRPLTAIDLNKLAYFYEDLHFSERLIEYLLEHCVSIGNRSIRYIESVAMSWADKGITTVEQAQTEGQHYRREYFQIIKAFGIRNRTPIDTEVEYMKKWMDEYHFTVDVICEACRRTVTKTGNAVFAYADTILRNWKEHGVAALRDIAPLDTLHQAKQQAKQQTRQTAATREQNTSGTRFNNFEQRNGYDFNQLEKQLNAT